MTKMFLTLTGGIAIGIVLHLFVATYIPKGIYHFDRVDLYSYYDKPFYTYVFTSEEGKVVRTRFQSATLVASNKNKYKILEYFIRFDNGWVMNLDTIIIKLHKGELKIIKEKCMVCGS